MAMVEKLQQVVMRVNRENGTLEAPKKERKHYLVLATFNESENGIDRDWHWIDGREETFQHLIEQMEAYDLLATNVLSETQSPETAVSAYTFLRFCMEEKKVSEDLLMSLEMDFDTFMEFMENHYPEKTSDELEEEYKKDLDQ